MQSTTHDAREIPITPARPGEEPGALTGIVQSLIYTVDHKKLGLMYIGCGLFYFVVAGLMASAIRIQLAIPKNDFLEPDVFNQLFTMHGTSMVFFVGMPIIIGMANYLVPLMIGARDMAFPRLNAFGFWMFFFSGILFYFSYLGAEGLYGAGSAPDVGWFAYSPLTARAFSRGHSTDYWTLSLLVSGIGSIATALNIIVTIICMRCKGMTLARMPLFVWMWFVTAFLILIAMPSLSACQIMLTLDRYLDAKFFDTQAGGSAVLWQHFFWIFGHPEVYILMVPGFAIASEVIPVFSRKPIFGYPIMVAATIMIGFISLGVWAHHMFTVGMTSIGNTFFAISTMIIAVPTGIKIFNWLGTMYGGKIRLELPMMFCIAFLFQFLIAGLTGVMLAVATFRLAAERLVFRRRPFPLRPHRRPALHALRRHLLLVSEGVRSHARCPTRPLALLALHGRIYDHVCPAAHLRHPRHAAPHLHLRSRTWLGNLEFHFDRRRRLPGGGHPVLRHQSDLVLLQGQTRWRRSVGRLDSGMDDHVPTR